MFWAITSTCGASFSTWLPTVVVQLKWLVSVFLHNRMFRKFLQPASAVRKDWAAETGGHGDGQAGGKRREEAGRRKGDRRSRWGKPEVRETNEGEQGDTKGQRRKMHVHRTEMGAMRGRVGRIKRQRDDVWGRQGGGEEEISGNWEEMKHGELI